MNNAAANANANADTIIVSRTEASTPTYRPDPGEVRRAIGRRSVATLATTSAAGRSHAATVLYQAVGDVLYVSTGRGSRKARNIGACPSVGVAIHIRRAPVGPPSTVQFQTRATLLAADDPEIVELAASGALRRITSHGELALADGCFLRLPLPGRLLTYGLGMSLRRLIADPLNAGGFVDLR